ncbi:MAG: hypothetical protein HYY40_10230 [Bacteroidetes bacterium]|nr:hypothetical protein [Bacteroidota bacterium]
MVKISRINTIIFVVMFIGFVLSAKMMALFHLKITGFEYVMWFVFTAFLALINIKFFVRNISVKKTYFILLLFLALFCFLNYFFASVPLIRYVQGAFFSFLFAANFILFYNLRIEKRDFYLVADLIIYFLATIAVLAYLERIFISGHYTSFFLRGVSTLLKDAGMAATLLNINIILCLGMFMIRRKYRYLLLAAFSFITICLLLFMKAVAASLIIFSFFTIICFDGRTRRRILYVSGIVLVLLLVILGKPFVSQIQYKYKLYFGSHSEQTPRIALYIAGFKIAWDHFPFGSGQGTFGSYPVGKHYSPVYYKYNLHNVYGLGPDAVRSKKENFLFDTYWSHIIGEMGFIAAFLYIWLWFFPAIKSLKYLSSASGEKKSMAFIITLTIITIFVESFALSIPEQLQFIMMYAGLGAIAFRLMLQDMQIQKSLS